MKDLDNENADGGDSADKAPTDDSTPKKGGIIGFIKANPVPTVIGGGLLAFGIYKMVTPKKKKADNLAGYRAKRAAEQSKPHRVAKHKSQHKKLPIKAVKLL
jgi:hypothetical protein